MTNQKSAGPILSMGTSFKKHMDPEYAKQTVIVESLFQHSNMQKAVVAAKNLVERYPQDAQANYLIAMALIRIEKESVALKFAQIANKLNSTNLEYIFLLGRIYLKLKLYEFAGPLLLSTIKIQPNDFRINWALADFQFEIGNGKEAKRLCEHALTLKASQLNKYDLMYNYATCLRSMSLIDEADKAFQKYGEHPAYSARALARRSRLHKYKPDSEMAQNVVDKIADPTTPIDAKQELLLSLGMIHENDGDYDKAYDYWTKSRELKSSEFSVGFGSGEIDIEIEYFSKELFEVAKPFGHPSKCPLFVVGMPRSGTTLIEQVLGAHTACYGAGELGRMHSLEYGFRKTYANDDYVNAIIANAKKGELHQRANEALSLMAKLSGPNISHVIDKTPTHYSTMGFSALCFPNAKFIHSQRHPADSFISSFQNNLNETHSYAYNQTSYVEAYLAKEKIMAHWRSCFPERIYDLQYERLVAKPEETVRDVLKFLDLPWDENCMQFFNNGKLVKTFSTQQVRTPIYTSSVYRWKNYEKHLGPLFAALKAANYEYPEV